MSDAAQTAKHRPATTHNTDLHCAHRPPAAKLITLMSGVIDQQSLLTPVTDILTAILLVFISVHSTKQVCVPQKVIISTQLL